MFAFLSHCKSYRLPIDVQLDIYGAEIYGAEIWGYNSAECLEIILKKFLKHLIIKTEIKIKKLFR